MNAPEPVNRAESTREILDPPDFRLLFESSPNLYLVLTPSFMIVGASDAYLQATMTKRDEVFCRNIFEIFPDNPDDPDASGVRNLTASLQRVVDHRVSDVMEVQQYDIRLPESAGGGFQERFWSPKNSPVMGTNNEVAYIIHRVEDVTEQIQAARSHRERQQQLERQVQERTIELQTSEERFRHLVEGTKDYAIYMLDPRGYIASWNLGAERITGYRADEILHQHFSRFYSTSDIQLGKPEQEIKIASAEGRYEEEGYHGAKMAHFSGPASSCLR